MQPPWPGDDTRIDMSTSEAAVREVTPLNLVARPNPRLLSFVVPMYNEVDVLPLLIPRFEALADSLPCVVEWVVVNDGSRDATAATLAAWAERDARVKFVDLARNFGHPAALTAGLDHASGDAVVIMDADLQDPPEVVVDMLARYREGYDIAYAQRTKRHGETAFKVATADAFYWIMRKFVHKDLPANSSDFRLMSRDAVQALGHLREGQRFLRGMVTWIGFAQVAVPFERPSRAAGTTKYSTRKMISFGWDAVLSFSTLPLRISTYFGFVTFVVGMLYGIRVFVHSLFYRDLVPGWATLVVLESLLGGAILVCLGMVGEYVGRIYEEIKQRPIYIVRRRLNLEGSNLPPRAVGPEHSEPRVRARI
jgi:glycosyltransferase involved in cell wall biosynthesis